MRINSASEWSFGEWVIADMDASDTAHVNAYNSNARGTVSAYASAFFSGCLLA